MASLDLEAVFSRYAFLEMGCSPLAEILKKIYSNFPMCCAEAPDERS
jgi:hypothetical protein